MSSTRPRTALALGALALGAALTGCSGSSGGGGGAAPAPVKALPAPVQSQVQTDVGEYLVKPTPDKTKQQVADTVAALKKMPGVQAVKINPDGRVDVTFLGGSTPAQRQAAVAQLAALGGTVEQGI